MISLLTYIVCAVEKQCLKLVLLNFLNYFTSPAINCIIKRRDLQLVKSQGCRYVPYAAYVLCAMGHQNCSLIADGPVSNFKSNVRTQHLMGLKNKALAGLLTPNPTILCCLDPSTCIAPHLSSGSGSIH